MARNVRTPSPPPTLPESSQRAAEGEKVWALLSSFLKHRAPNTQRTYLGILEEWCEFLGAEAGSPQAAHLLLRATEVEAARYRHWLERRPGERPRAARAVSAGTALSTTRVQQEPRDGMQHTQSNATIAKKFAALRRMYRALMAHDLGIRHNPFDVDRTPPPARESGRKRPTEMVDFSLVTQVLEMADPSEPKGLRDRAILSVLFGGGLRRSEVRALRIADVRRSARGTLYLYLRATKAQRDAQQALPRWAAESVEQLVAQRRAEGAKDGDYLFVSYRGRGGRTLSAAPISTSGIYNLFKRYCKLAGAGEFCTPHSARATAITRLLAQGIPHREVQEFSRHASVQMVELYDKRRLSVEENPAHDLEYD